PTGPSTGTRTTPASAVSSVGGGTNSRPSTAPAVPNSTATATVATIRRIRRFIVRSSEQAVDEDADGPGRTRVTGRVERLGGEDDVPATVVRRSEGVDPCAAL